MQPYFFPYLGYFQLLNSADKFVFYDDVNFIKGGWVNRNRLFLAGEIRYITVPLSHASPFAKINKTRLQGGDRWATDMLSTICQSYGKAPFYKSVYELIESVLRGHDGYLSTVARNSITSTAEYLGLERNFVLSSDIYGNQDKGGIERVLDICELEEASEYLNLPGGQDLYDPDRFARKGIHLKFVDVSIKPYRQFSQEFSPMLSILDVLMFNDPGTVKDMLSVDLV